MSTQSFIGVLCKEGIIKFVYCHSDGYPSYLGKMLLEHYNTPELATALVDLGSLSMVRERLAPDEEATTYKDTNANSIAAGKCKFVAKNSGILFV